MDIVTTTQVAKGLIHTLRASSSFGCQTFRSCECFKSIIQINISICMKKVIIFLSVLLIACNSNTSTSENGLTQDKLITEGGNHKFFLMAAEGSMTELASGRFASGHATDQRLKDYGYEMIKDHGNLLGQLKQLALLRNITLPDTVNNNHQKLLDVLHTKAGNSFDSIYMVEIINHQKKLIHLYDKIQTSSDTALRSYAIKTLPVITNHLLHLITIRDSINIKKK